MWHAGGCGRGARPFADQTAARAGVAPEAVLYVGDQYQNDVVGARGAGTAAVLLDRYGLQSERLDCVRIASLDEVADHLA